jgi:hypothetical protein
MINQELMCSGTLLVCVPLGVPVSTPGMGHFVGSESPARETGPFFGSGAPEHSKGRPRIKPGIAPAVLWLGAGMACVWALIIWYFTR